MAVHNKSYQPVQSLTVKAAEDLPAFRFVSHLGTLCSAATKALGITDVDWLNGEYASVVSLGTMAVETSTTVDLGDDVTSDANGLATPAVSDNPVNGRALDSCTGAGYVKIKIVP
jgi:hypothetical protein